MRSRYTGQSGALAADGVDLTEQRLSGAADASIYEVCRNEGRVLVTLDHDFGHTLRFSPDATAGIVVIERKGRISPAMILERVRELIALLRTRPIDRELWIVKPGRIRIHERK